MSYIVYHRKSTVSFKTFNTESSAKRSATCMNRNAGSDEYTYALDTVYYSDVVKMVERTNIMTGQKYLEPSNTPRFCSPSPESYWTM